MGWLNMGWGGGREKRGMKNQRKEEKSN